MIENGQFDCRGLVPTPMATEEEGGLTDILQCPATQEGLVSMVLPTLHWWSAVATSQGNQPLLMSTRPKQLIVKKKIEANENLRITTTYVLN